MSSLTEFSRQADLGDEVEFAETYLCRGNGCTEPLIRRRVRVVCPSRTAGNACAMVRL